MNANEKKESLMESKIQEKFDHPNIVKCHETYTTTNGKLCTIMEYADGGDLQTKIKS